MAHQTKVYPINSVVERAIDIVGSASELRFKIGTRMGKEVTRQTFQGWRNRAAFSIEAVPAVHSITRIPQSDLIAASIKSTAKKMLLTDDNNKMSV